MNTISVWTILSVICCFSATAQSIVLIDHSEDLTSCTSVWTYEVTNGTAHDLSHFVIGTCLAALEDCIEDVDDIDFNNPDWKIEYGRDGSIQDRQVCGIKFELESESVFTPTNDKDTITFTLDYVPPVGVDTFYFKSANIITIDTAFGPGSTEVCDCNTLPIQLISFEGQDNQGIHTLDWQAYQAVGFSHFELQHSRDLIHWEKMKDISLHEDLKYSYEWIADKGRHYYRLLSWDIDGSYAVSDIVTLENNVSLFDQRSILKEAVLYDQVGRQIDFNSELPVGVYYIRFKGDTHKYFKGN